MGWRKPDIDDIYATLTKDEVEVYRASAQWTSDPIKRLCDRAAAYVRGHLKSNGRVKMSPNEEEIPEATISPAMDYLAFDILKRLGGSISDARSEARRQAIAFFGQIASGEIKVEDYGETAGLENPRIAIGIKPPVL